MTSNVAPTPPTAPRPRNYFGLVALILALVGFGIAFAAPVAFLAWFFTLPAFVLGIIGFARKNRPKVASIAAASLSTVAFILSVVLFSGYVAGTPTMTVANGIGKSSHHTITHHAKASPAPMASATPSSSPAPVTTPTASPTPTVVQVAVPSATSMSPTTAENALSAAGLSFKFVSASGATELHVYGWRIVREAPAAGASVPPGTVVVLTVTPPPPPPVVHHVTPVAPSGPVGATARCRDGTYSYSAHRQGTCSHHGGVAVWL